MDELNEQINRMKSLMGLSLVNETLEANGNNQLYFHGGNLDDFQQYDNQSKVGSLVYGFGLYLTTSRDVAEKYAKGSRKLYCVEVDNNIKTYDNVNIKKQTVMDVLSIHLSKQKMNLIKKYLERVNDLDIINAGNLNNFLLNENLLSKNNIQGISNFFLFQGVDGDVSISPFGFGEKQLVLINYKKVKNITKIDRKDSRFFDDFEY